jgi:hypothetical protein
MHHAYATSDSGVRELFLYYGDKEVSFDEERLFPFGEQLMKQTSFVAESATTWGPGYEWSEIRDMLEALATEGILKHGQADDDPRGGGLVPSQLEPSVCPEPRTWSLAECEGISRDLGGRPVEVGYLEAIISVYRTVHPAMDGDGRQVGEANVFPPGLRLDRDTEWRICQYSGSRYRDDRPMNVTALKAMIKYWKPMMAALLEIRAAVRKRLPRVREPGWTVSDLHLFAGIALSVPGFQNQRHGGATPQVPMSPVLSSMFRITDGIRMTTHEMLFLSDERTRDPDEPVTAAELYGFAERNGTFLAGLGVCAGPKAMIDEFFSVVFDGTHVPGTETLVQPPEVRALLDELPLAIDYALLGLMSWSVSRSVWCSMSLAYKGLRGMFETAPDDGGICQQLRDRFNRDWPRMEQQRIGDDYEREVHMVVYRDTYEESWKALGTPHGAPTLAERIAPLPESAMHIDAAKRFRDILGQRFAGSVLGAAAGEIIDEIVALLVGYLREEQAILGQTTELQGEISDRLERPRARRPLTARDLKTTFVMYGGSIAEFPYLFDMIEEELGIRVEATAGTIEVTDLRAAGTSP